MILEYLKRKSLRVSVVLFKSPVLVRDSSFMQIQMDASIKICKIQSVKNEIYFYFSHILKSICLEDKLKCKKPIIYASLKLSKDSLS
jgi:hypothetical protein